VTWRPNPAGAAHEDEILAPAHALREGVAFGLRDLLAGVDVAALAEERGVGETTSVLEVLGAAVLRGDLAEGPGPARFRLTEQGALFADRVARDVLAAP
jgi:coproporphyrinogen III oxidase-like Fe-S oxidoreductase